MGKIIGICNQKGGTAKTTTAINLSAYFGQAGKKTLLIDMDPQGNATSGVGVDSNGKNSIYDLLSGKVTIEQSIYPTEYPNLDIIPADISLTGGEVELVNISGRELLLREVLGVIKDSFSFIIVDAPPSLGLLTVNVLTAADSIIIPIQCEYYALEGVSKLINTVELIQNRLNPNLEIEGILLTMADFRTKLTLQVIEEVRRYFQQKVFNVIVPRNVKLAEAPSFGKPISVYDPACVGSKSYLKVSQEVMKNNFPMESLVKERS
ncbi:MAG: AAA family ATPase [Candidatus Omnitrophica bacterium]|nr:AAA family ATPase [Candidatus Omnitrophota bacterium]MBU2043879.1 AAA family ATPase [Candidatus Omnitrophota bacterium]MBU2265823.1 AAA family ATPase [Candidatus Omnitrophota bacterium]